MKLDRRAKCTVAFLIFICGLTLLLLAKPSPAPIIVMPVLRTTPRNQKWSDRLVRALPGWVLQMKSAFLGPAKNIDLQATVVQFRGAPEAVASNLLIGSAQFETSDGVQIWILPEDQLNSFRKRLKRIPEPDILFRPSIVTSDGVEATFSYFVDSIYANGRPMPIDLDLYWVPRATRRGIDLKTAIALTVGTDSADLKERRFVTVAVNARVQIPARGAAFFLCPTIDRTQPTQIGTLISATKP